MLNPSTFDEPYFTFKTNTHMENVEASANINFIQRSTIYSFCKNAFSLIKSGHAKEAKKQYPYEYFFIDKHYPSSLEELTQLVTKKLELH